MGVAGGALLCLLMRIGRIEYKNLCNMSTWAIHTKELLSFVEEN